MMETRNGCCSRSRDMPSRGIAAYRGASNTHPENTLAAFREAIRLGAHMIEMDVCFTKDLQLVLMHDTTVDRTTNGSGRVADLTLESIKRLDAGAWKSSQFRGERVPTLREALQIMPANIWLDIHLRGGAEMGEGVAETVLEEQRIQQSFLACDLEAASAALQVASGIGTCIGEARLSDAGVRETIAQNRNVFLFRPKSTSVPPTPALNTSDVSIIYYDAEGTSPEELPALFDSGIHFVMSPSASILVEAAAMHGIRPLEPCYVSGD